MSVYDRWQYRCNTANQLIDSFDYVAGTTSFYYDNNGNLVEQLPPGAYISHWYTYDQRNLLTSQGRSQLAENITITSFSYDGTGNRLTQTDHTTPGGPTTTTYTNDILGLSQVLVADDGNSQTTHFFGLDLISQDNGTETRTLLPDGLGSVRTEMVGSAIETLTTYEPFGNPLSQTGSSGTVYGFTGEQFDSTTGLLYLRARYYNPALHTFMTKDPWSGNMQKSISMHSYAYGYNSPPNLTDPSGFDPWWCDDTKWVYSRESCYATYTNAIPVSIQNCPVGRWDCEAVNNISALKQAFLNSAVRHNKIPGMDNNGFAALLASIIVSERRIGNVPLPPDPRDRSSQFKENLVASLGCTVSGSYLQQAMDTGDYTQLIRYLTNQDVPQRATVGIGNVWLETAANLWHGQACSSTGSCTSVELNPLKTTNTFGWEIDMPNPFGPQYVCAMGNCFAGEPSETEAYVDLTLQLLDNEMNIEYVAANLEAGAARAIALGFIPTAFNLASWHLRGLQSNDEIDESGWNPGGAIYILDDIPTALHVLGIPSSWNSSMDSQYGYYNSSSN